MTYRELEVSIEGEQDHENQHQSQWADEGKLRSGFQKLAVLSAPCQLVTLREGHGFAHSGLAVLDSACQVTTFDAVLDADVSGIVLAINERGAIPLGDASQLRQRDLHAVRGSYQQVADFLGTAAELGLHAHHEVEELLALDDLRDRLTTYRSLRSRLPRRRR